MSAAPRTRAEAPAAQRARGALLARCVIPRRVETRPDLRSGARADIQLIAGVGRYEVDVLIRVLGENHLELVGQVTGAERVYEPVSRLPVVLYDADAMEAVGRAVTDPFGEFEMRGLPAARYVLALGSARDAPCMLIWEGGRRAAHREAPV